MLVGDLGPDTDWRHALPGAEFVIHLSARVHAMRDTAPDPLAPARRVNVLGSLNLASQAAQAGVKRFVFLSSVKVNGERGVYSEAAPPAPVDAYGISKSEAELGLRWLATETGMEVVIIRSPLV